MSNHEPSAYSIAKRSITGGRQLTIGEVICMERYARGMLEAGCSVTMLDALRYADDVRVCTTCGWGEVVHNDPRESGSSAQVCGRYAPRYARG